MSPSPSHAIIGDGGAGWAQLPYLIKILMENYKRYKQLQSMMRQAKNADHYFKTIHSGIEGIEGLIRALPVDDNGVLSDVVSFKKSLEVVSKVYGAVPDSPEALLHKLHDDTVAESFRMVNSFKDYSKKQESNSNAIQVQSEAASPKGAAKATAVSNALILKSVNQLIRLQSQSLKMQSEELAIKNRTSKNSAASYKAVDKNIGKAFEKFKRQKEFVKF